MLVSKISIKNRKIRDFNLISESQGIKCVDLFCGAGGLTHGFVMEGLNVVAGIDLDAACKYPYEENNSAKFLSNGDPCSCL